MLKQVLIPPQTDLNLLIKSSQENSEKIEQINFDDESFLFDDWIYDQLPSTIKELFPLIGRPRNRDVSLLTMLTIFGAIVKNYQSNHGDAPSGPQLYFYLLGNAGSGKSVAASLQELGKPYHRYLRKKYIQELEEYQALSTEEKKGIDPPRKRFLFAPGDTTKAAFFIVLNENHGYAFIFLTEADTLNASLASQHGSFKDLLRNGFDGHGHSVARVTFDDGPIEIEHVNLSVVLTSTVNQCYLLIPSSEDGLFSRFIFYIIPPDYIFEDVFQNKDLSQLKKVKKKIASIFTFLGIRSEKESAKTFEFTNSQADELNAFFTDIKYTFGETQHVNLLGSINRLALIFRRIAMQLCYLREFSDHGKVPGQIICNEVDFNITKSIIKSLLHHLKCVSYLYQEQTQIQQNLKYIPTNADLNPEVKKADMAKKIFAINLIKKGLSYRQVSKLTFGNERHSGTIKKWVDRNKTKPFPFPETETLPNAKTIKVEESLRAADVDVYQNIRTSSYPLGQTDLYDLVTSTAFQGEVTSLRDCTDPILRKRKKEGLPAFTTSGRFKGKRSKENLSNHSRFICLDIDAGDNEHIANFNDLKEQLRKVVNIAYCGHSVGGTGYYVLIPIGDPVNHEKYFAALQVAFEKLGIKIDISCGDVSRLRILSYEPNYYMPKEATLFDTILPATNPPPSAGGFGIGNPRFKLLLAKIKERKVDITATYADWFAIACAIANEFGEQGLNYFHELSCHYPNYSFEESEKQFRACLKFPKRKGGYSLRTIFAIAQKY